MRGNLVPTLSTDPSAVGTLALAAGVALAVSLEVGLATESRRGAGLGVGGDATLGLLLAGSLSLSSRGGATADTAVVAGSCGAEEGTVAVGDALLSTTLEVVLDTGLSLLGVLALVAPGGGRGDDLAAALEACVVRFAELLLVVGIEAAVRALELHLHHGHELLELVHEVGDHLEIGLGHLDRDGIGGLGHVVAARGEVAGESLEAVGHRIEALLRIAARLDFARDGV